jgi:hypothetical protein
MEQWCDFDEQVALSDGIGRPDLVYAGREADWSS